MFKPTLTVRRLVIKQNAHVAYDEHFHVGVNVIRGENSSGKSTILNAIFYGLGGDLADWSEAALQCTHVFVEASLNGNIITLCREISKQNGMPMEIFPGSFEIACLAPKGEWKKYPYRRSATTESFSQSLFRLLQLPEASNDHSGNITIHQVLRLLYADQLSPVENIFRYDGQFDSPILRDAVGRLVFGAYESDIYENELKLRQLNRDFDLKHGEMRSMFRVLGSEHNLTLEWVAAERSTLNAERRQTVAEIETNELQTYSSDEIDALTLTQQRVAFENVQVLQQRLGALEDRKSQLALTMSDSRSFIANLKQKMLDLSEASLVVEHVGNISFTNCPACYGDISTRQTLDGLCHLCQESHDPTKNRVRILDLIANISIQLKQSERLQRDREEEFRKTEEKIAAAETEWLAASRNLSALQRLPSSELKERMRLAQRRLGYLDRQLEDLTTKEKLIETIDRLSKEKEALQTEINRLSGQNDLLRSVQDRRLSESFEEVSEAIKFLLTHDLRRQDSFEDPQHIQFDFASNRLSVDGQTYFSASSRVILKSSFFFGLFVAACTHPKFRHPRFCIIDTIEDKGMEPQRSHNFQNLILSTSRKLTVEHQVIFATAMISPDLDDEAITVGKFSTRDDPTLTPPQL